MPLDVDIDTETEKSLEICDPVVSLPLSTSRGCSTIVVPYQYCVIYLSNCRSPVDNFSRKLLSTVRILNFSLSCF